jgi:probable addiction module antidote protein
LSLDRWSLKSYHVHDSALPVMKAMARRTGASWSDHDTVVAEMFREDPGFAADYLNGVLEDGDPKELMLAMRRVAEAFGGVPELARRTNLHSKTLYRTLSPRGNPELKSLTGLLRAMGMRIAVAPIGRTRKEARRPKSGRVVARTAKANVRRARAASYPRNRR